KSKQSTHNDGMAVQQESVHRCTYPRRVNVGGCVSMKSKNLFCLVMGILGAGAIIGYALYSNSYSDGGGAESDINSRDVVTTVSVSIMPSSIEEKAIKADAVVIGTVKEV